MRTLPFFDREGGEDLGRVGTETNLEGFWRILNNLVQTLDEAFNSLGDSDILRVGLDFVRPSLNLLLQHVQILPKTNSVNKVVKRED